MPPQPRPPSKARSVQPKEGSKAERGNKPSRGAGRPLRQRFPDDVTATMGYLLNFAKPLIREGNSYPAHSPRLSEPGHLRIWNPWEPELSFSLQLWLCPSHSDIWWLLSSRVAPLCSPQSLPSPALTPAVFISSFMDDFLLKRNLSVSRQGRSCKFQKPS